MALWDMEFSIPVLCLDCPFLCGTQICITKSCRQGVIVKIICVWPNAHPAYSLSACSVLYETPTQQHYSLVPRPFPLN